MHENNNEYQRFRKIVSLAFVWISSFLIIFQPLDFVIADNPQTSHQNIKTFNDAGISSSQNHSQFLSLSEVATPNEGNLDGLTSLSSSNRGMTCPAGMISYWEMEETSKGSYVDSYGDNDAFCVGAECPAHTPNGILGGGQAFSSSPGNKMTVPANASFDFGVDDSFSIEYWMKGVSDTTCTTGNEAVIARVGSSNSLHIWTGCRRNISSDYLYAPRWNLAENDGSYVSIEGTKNIADGNWHHIVAIRDAAANMNYLYVDGVMEAQAPAIYDTGFSSSADGITIGYRYFSSPDYFFTGTIDEVAVYNIALPSDLITEHYNGGIGKKYCEIVSNLAPQITSTPITDGQVGVLYSYDVGATGEPAPMFSLITSPANMNIDPASGLIQWTPSSAGVFDITVEAANTEGSDTQPFTIHITTSPPDFPSSYYGYVQFVEDDFTPIPDTTHIDAYTDGGVIPAASTLITESETDLGYAVDVPGNISDPQPTTVTFKIAERIVAIAPWVYESNTRVDIHPPYPDAGGPYAGIAGDSITLSANAVDLGGGDFEFTWDLNNDTVYDDAIGPNPSVLLSSGVQTIHLKVTDNQGGEGFTNTDLIGLTLSGLTSQVYDGLPKSVAVNPVNPYTTIVTYHGVETPPTNAGSYPIDIIVMDGTTTIDTISGGNMVIDPRPITVTAVAATKEYDGDTNCAANPTITPGSLVGTDSGDWIQTFNDKDVGTGKTLTPTGMVNDGNNGENYWVTFESITTGQITPKPITIIAVTDTKTFDGTTFSTKTPIADSLVGTDAAEWHQRFADANAGTGKTLIPYGTIIDGNNGENYTKNYVNNIIGEITPKPITVIADAVSKVYGTADPELTYTYIGDLVGDDTFSGELSRTAGEAPGIYPIEQYILTLGQNYDITYQGADFTITAFDHAVGQVSVAVGLLRQPFGDNAFPLVGLSLVVL